MDRMVSRLVVKMTLLMLMFQLAKAAAPVAKFGCPDRCGAISIPYPFGTRKECYMDERFAIECNETANPPRAFISRIKMEVLNISVKTATATVKSPVISFNCIGRVDGAPLNLTGTPFVFSSKRNLFVAVGCDTRAFMTGTEPDLVVWESTWGNLESNVRLQENKMCSGQNCSLARIPSLLQVFNPRLVSTNANQVGEGCKLAFLVNPTWFESNISDPFAMQYRDYVPMDLGWMMNLNDNDISTHCEESYNQSSKSECVCEDGFEGNPYLELGFIGLVGVLFLLIGARWIYNCIRLKKKFFKRNGGLLLQQQLSSSDGSVQKTKIFSSNELEKATDYFNESRILGHGGQGTVYKGMLADGTIVAVKKSKIVDEDKLEEFINEVVILSQISHRNVVRLLGCCLETDVPLLVYEFIPNGTLFQYLHEQNEDFTLSWELRLRIASEAAGAISYLHSTASIPIYHRDIKSTNILLDEKYRAKVSDFGTSRSVSIDQTHLTTKVQGTFGYLDPEYFRTSQLTEKSDVYSFGVVLVELLSGKKPIFLTHSLETMSLAEHFIELMEDSRLFDIIDAQVKGDCTEEEAIVIANLAKRCLNLNGRNRPTMREVAMELEGILLSRNGINIQQIGEVDNSSRSISCSSFEIGIDLPLDCKPSTSSETW
ncbi:hypothetical protein POPTR_003G186200v4 [Populus trichocarpa]|uniref:Uncharacterized protein n=1 Tax=Populus trichocarpa TaxID=3694 RepID=A0ACC0TAT8_POPTR|nr:hypothetical protein POPTR_003G186200v4 [Populus trichocarpa]